MIDDEVQDKVFHNWISLVDQNPEQYAWWLQKDGFIHEDEMVIISNEDEGKLAKEDLEE